MRSRLPGLARASAMAAGAAWLAAGAGACIRIGDLRPSHAGAVGGGAAGLLVLVLILVLLAPRD